MIDAAETGAIRSLANCIPVKSTQALSRQELATISQLVEAIDAQVGPAAQREADGANARMVRAGKRPRWSRWHFHESELQRRIYALAVLLERRRLDLYSYAPVNQATVTLTDQQRLDLAAVGLRAGIPDLRHDLGSRGWYVELKAPGGGCDDDQVSFNWRAWAQGQPSYVVYTVAEWLEIFIAELVDERGPEALRDPGRRIDRPKEVRATPARRRR